MKITSGKSTLFGHFFVKYFLITCVHICISLNTNDNTTILHTCLTSYWSCLRSTAGYLMIPLWFRVMGVKKAKTVASSWLHEKLNFSDKSNFQPLLWQSLIYKKWYSSQKLSEDYGYELFFFFNLWGKPKKNMFKLDLVIWR